MSFLLCIYCMMQVLSQQVIWKDTIIDIPVGEPLTSYIDMPQASLYIGGEEVFDDRMYYVKDGVERTFLSTVNTSIVRSYEIKYRVHYPTFNLIYTQTIIFRVIDDIPPYIHTVPQFKIPLGSKLPDLGHGLVISDNYNDVNSLEVFIESQHVILNKTGIYPIYYHVIDTSNNKSSAQTTLEIYDPLPPEIILKKPVVLEYGDDFDWRDFFQIKDNVDISLDVYVCDDTVNYQKLGTYPFYIKAVDQSGLSSKLHTTISIIDSIKPVIRLTSHPKPLGIFETITDEILLSYVVLVADNYDDLKLEDIYITHDIDIYRLGEYLVLYSVKDSSDNLFSIQLKIKVVDHLAPTVLLNEMIIYDVFDQVPNLMQHFTYFDNYDMPYDLNVTIKGTCDMKNVGIYPMSIEVIDKAKHKTVLAFDCYVVDRIAPTIIQKAEILITNYQKQPLIHYFEITDNYNHQDQLDITIDDRYVIYDEIGIYDVLICARDDSQNETCIHSTVMIADVTPPLLKLSKAIWIIDIKTTSLDLKSLIEIASDDYDHLDINDVQISHNIMYHKIGRYEVYYDLLDTSMNEVQVILTVIIDTLDPITIQASDLWIEPYGAIDPLKGIEVSNHHISYEILYDISHVKPDIAGIYQVNYVLIDARGQTYRFERDIIITNEAPKRNLTQFLPILGVNTLLGALLFILYKRR